MGDLRASILNARDLPTKKIYIPEWECDVCIRTIMGPERDLLESSLLNEKGDSEVSKGLVNMRARFAVVFIGDENNERIFADSDIEAIGKKSASALDRIMDEGKSWNRMGDSFDVEDEAKNLESAQSDSSGSD